MNTGWKLYTGGVGLIASAPLMSGYPDASAVIVGLGLLLASAVWAEANERER